MVTKQVQILKRNLPPGQGFQLLSSACSAIFIFIFIQFHI